MRRPLRSLRVLVIAGLASAGVSACGGARRAPSTFIQTHDEAGVWKSIEIRDGVQRNVLWSTLVDALSSKFDIEVLDKESGYIRTSYKFTSVDEGTKEDNYRSRIVAKYNADWTVLQVKSESGWLQERSRWLDGYDSQVLNDVYGDLRGRLGRVAR